MNIIQLTLLLFSVIAGAWLYQSQSTQTDTVQQPTTSKEPEKNKKTVPKLHEGQPLDSPDIVLRTISPPTLRPRIQNPYDKWYLGSWDEKTLENMADVDAILNLDIPTKGAGDEAFYHFSQRLKNIKMGRRYSAYGQTSPLLAADAYIAKYSPNTIYKLYNNGQYDSGRLSHLIKYGYLQDWPQHIHDIQTLVLSSHLALLSILMSQGHQAAAVAFTEAFFNFDNPALSRRSISVRNLRFAHASMTAEQKNRLNTAFINGERIIDNRSVRSLKQSGILTITRRQAIKMIENLGPENHSERRGMSSYFGHAAGYGSEYFFRLMVEDVVDNRKQPNHFYCAACGVAVFGEGLLGAPLIDRIKQRETSSAR